MEEKQPIQIKFPSKDALNQDERLRDLTECLEELCSVVQSLSDKMSDFEHEKKVILENLASRKIRASVLS